MAPLGESSPKNYSRRSAEFSSFWIAQTRLKAKIKYPSRIVIRLTVNVFVIADQIAFGLDIVVILNEYNVPMSRLVDRDDEEVFGEDINITQPSFHSAITSFSSSGIAPWIESSFETGRKTYEILEISSLPLRVSRV